MERRVRFLLLPAVLAAPPLLAAFLYTRSPSKGIFIPCIFRYATGLDCPGCGMARAFYDLLHGRLLEAVHYNPFFPVLVGAMLWGWLQLLHYLWRGRFFTLRVRVPLAAVWVVCAAVLVYSVLRNLPFAPFSSLWV